MATATKKLAAKNSSHRAAPVRVAKLLKSAKLSKPAPALKAARPSSAVAPANPTPAKRAAKAVVAPPAKAHSATASSVKATRPKKVLAAPSSVKAAKPVTPRKASRSKTQPLVKLTPAKSRPTKPVRAETQTKSAPSKSNAATQGILALEIAPKGIRKRAPKDLAAQYGEKIKPQRGAKTASTPKATRAARKSAEERERLREVINPSDEVLHRLARIGAIVSTSDTLEADGEPRRKSLTSRRSRHWELSCGKCGTKTKFSASAGVCPRCGTIVLRD